MIPRFDRLLRAVRLALLLVIAGLAAAALLNGFCAWMAAS